MKPTLALLGARGLGAGVARPVAGRLRRRFLLMIAAGKAARRGGDAGPPAAPAGPARH